MIVAGVCIVVAGVFLLRRELNTAFVIAALGLVAWFLDYRAQMKATLAATELQELSHDGEEIIYEDSDDD